MTDRPSYLTSRALARALDVHVDTIRRWTRAGRIRPTLRTAGGYPRYSLDEVREQLSEAQEHDEE